MKAKRILALFMVFILFLCIAPAAYAAEAAEAETTEPEATDPEHDPDLDPELAAMGFVSDELTGSYVTVYDQGVSTLSTSKYAGLRRCAQMDFGEVGAGVKNWYYADEDETDGKPDYWNLIYCLESQKKFSSGSGNAGSSDLPMDGTGSNHGESVWYGLSRDQRRAVGLILLYGCPTKLKDTSYANGGINAKDNHDLHNPNIGYRYATQALVWEITDNMRQSTWPYTRTNSTLYDEAVGICTSPDGSIDYFVEAYNSIVKDMYLHNFVPSFTDRRFAQAPAIPLINNAATVTDTNGVLDRFKFPSTDNVSLIRDGFDLQIKVTGEIPSGVNQATYEILDPEGSLYEVWYNQYDSSKQVCVRVSLPVADPVTAYFKLRAAAGGIALKKTTEDGKNLAGWQFNIYADAACTNLISGPHATDKNGELHLNDLPIGDVWIKELGTCLSDIFDDMNRYIFEKQGVDLNHVYIDGTKLKANANNYSWVWKKSCINNRNDEFIAHYGACAFASDMDCFQPLMEGFYKRYGFYPQYPVADAGYGSFNNYLYCQEKGMEKHMKFTMYEKETRDEKYRNDPFRACNFAIDEEGYMRCPNGKRFLFLKTAPVTGNQYGRTEEYYQCEDCTGCPYREKCHKSKENRIVRINEELTQFHNEVLANLNSVHGALLRTNRSIQSEGGIGWNQVEPAVPEDSPQRDRRRNSGAGADLLRF